MGLLGKLLSMFGGGGGGSDFAGLNPDDVNAYARASIEISDAERQGEAELAAAWSRYGIRDEEHWDRVRSAFANKHRHNPDMLFADCLIGIQEGFDKAAQSGHPVPPEVLAPVEGISLHYLALIQASLEQAGADPAAVYARYQTTPDRYAHAQQVWQQRMAHSQDAFSASMLGQNFHTFHAMAQTFVAKGHAMW